MSSPADSEDERLREVSRELMDKLSLLERKTEILSEFCGQSDAFDTNCQQLLNECKRVSTEAKAIDWRHKDIHKSDFKPLAKRFETLNALIGKLSAFQTFIHMNQTNEDLLRRQCDGNERVLHLFGKQLRQLETQNTTLNTQLLQLNANQSSNESIGGQKSVIKVTKRSSL